MSLAQRLVESPPSIAWHRARLMSPLYRRAFAAFGSGTVMVRPAILRGVDRISVGNDCAFYTGAWLACEDGAGPIRIGDRNYFGQRTHLHAGAPIVVGDDCVFVDDVYIGSADHDRFDRSRSVTTSPVRIGSRVFLGQRVTVLGGVTIGDGATVGANAVVTRDVPAGGVVAGVPARSLGVRG
jgi:acetyltransferase-like isoleucine patch superfamily enzyme